MSRDEIIHQRLLAPFPVTALDFKPLDGTMRDGKAKPYCYPDIRAVTDRLVKSIGVNDFKISTDFHHISPFLYEKVDKHNKEAKLVVETHFKACIGVTIGIRIGEDNWVTRSNVGEAEKRAEAMTTAYSQAFKRAAVLFGLGRYLYDMDLPLYPYNRGFDTNKIFQSPEFDAAVKKALEASGFEFKCEETGQKVDWKTASLTVAKLGRVLSIDAVKKITGAV